MEENISPKQKGLNTELHCISYFSDCGFLVSTPYGDNGRYDMIVDVFGTLLRVQVKTASLAYDCDDEVSGIKFSCRSARINTKETYSKRYTKDEIDYFATYWNNQVYVVPVEETSNQKNLRFFETKNHQDDQASFLEDYTILKQWSKFIPEEYRDNLEPEKNNIFIEYNRDKKETKVTYHCKRCGKIISEKNETGYCIDCYHFLSRKVDRPDREELKNLIRNVPFTQIAKKYNVSDKAIVKWCKGEDLPSTKKEINSISDANWKLI